MGSFRWRAAFATSVSPVDLWYFMKKTLRRNSTTLDTAAAYPRPFIQRTWIHLIHKGLLILLVVLLSGSQRHFRYLERSPGFRSGYRWEQ